MVSIQAGGKPVKLTTTPPLAATQSSNPSGFSLPRNICVTWGPYGHGGGSKPEYCGYPMIYGTDGNTLNATARIGSDGTSIVLQAAAPPGFKVAATSYGRAQWPMTVFFAEGSEGLPVIPWYAAVDATNPYTPPGWDLDIAEITNRDSEEEMELYGAAGFVKPNAPADLIFDSAPVPLYV